MPTDEVQAAMEIVTLGCYGCFHYTSQPFKSKRDNDLQTWVYLFEIITILGLLTFYPSGEANNNDTVVGDVVLCMIYFIALLMCIFCICKAYFARNSSSEQGEKGIVMEMIEVIVSPMH